MTAVGIISHAGLFLYEALLFSTEWCVFLVLILAIYNDILLSAWFIVILITVSAVGSSIARVAYKTISISSPCSNEALIPMRPSRTAEAVNNDTSVTTRLHLCRNKHIYFPGTHMFNVGATEFTPPHFHERGQKL